MWTTIIGKEFTARLQGKLAYTVLTFLVALFTALTLASFWLIVVSVPTIVPVIGSSVGSGSNVTIQSVVASNRGAFLFYALTLCLLAAVFSVAPAVASSGRRRRVPAAPACSGVGSQVARGRRRRRRRRPPAGPAGGAGGSRAAPGRAGRTSWLLM